MGDSMNEKEKIKSILAFQHLYQKDPRRASLVFSHFDDLDNIDIIELLRQAVEQNYIRKTLQIGDLFDAVEYADQVMERCKRENIQVLTRFDEKFPDALRFPGGPDLIYYKGDLSILDNPKRAAVIGTRYPEKEGEDFAYQAGQKLAENGYTVVSGLAVGCDRAGHEGCLDAEGKTVAFVPSNLSNIAPRGNQPLARRILENGGLLVSMFSPLHIQHSDMYVLRDRLQAGCSNFLLTSEFDANSGTLQTLRFAGELDRPVYTLDTLVDNVNFTGVEAAENIGIHINPVSYNALDALLASDNQ